MNPWIYLLLAGVFEVCWTVGLKASHGLTKLVPSLFTLFTLSLSMFFLAKATAKLPIGTAYAVWVGIGVIGASLFGVLFFQEYFSFKKAFFLGLLLISIVGLKMS